MTDETTSAAAGPFDPKRVAALTEQQQETFRNRTGKSAETHQRAEEVMPGGVPSRNTASVSKCPVAVNVAVEVSAVTNPGGNDFVAIVGPAVVPSQYTL